MNFAEPPVKPKEMSVTEMIGLLEFLETGGVEYGLFLIGYEDAGLTKDTINHTIEETFNKHKLTPDSWNSENGIYETYLRGLILAEDKTALKELIENLNKQI